MRQTYFLNVNEKFHDPKDLFNAASKAKDDIRAIVREMDIPVFSMRKNSTPVKLLNTLIDAFRYLSLLTRILFNIKKGGILIVQRRLSYVKIGLLTKILNLRGCQLCLIVHDINSLRFEPHESEIKGLNKARFLIVHTKAMKEKLTELGVKTQMIVLDIFDYVTDKSPIAKRKNSDKVVFAGNLDKTDFLPLIRHISAPEFYFYGFHMPEKLSGITNITYKGKFSPMHVCDIDGSWGLVWDGNSIDTCSGLLGKYLRYNAPHKCSLYIAAHLPLIVWEESAMAPFVRENEIGICVKSIGEIKDGISKISDDEYAEMQRKLEMLSKRLDCGEQMKNAIRKVSGEITEPNGNTMTQNKS